MGSAPLIETKAACATLTVHILACWTSPLDGPISLPAWAGFGEKLVVKIGRVRMHERLIEMAVWVSPAESTIMDKSWC